MAKSSLALWSLILSLSFLIEVNADSAPSSQNPTSPLVPRKQDDFICQTVRAPSYYGLGVRLGIYCTWIQSLIANASMPGEITPALDKNSIFLSTLLIAMVKCSSMGMLMQVDGIVLTHLTGGYIFGILSIWGYRTCIYAKQGTKAIKNFGSFGTHFRLLIILSQSAFGWWFWTYGVTGSLDPLGPSNGNSEKCGTLYTFMFGKVEALGMIRKYYMALYGFGMAYFGTMMLISLLAGYTKISTMVKLARSGNWAESSRLGYATGIGRKDLTRIYSALRWISLLWLIFSVLLVELTLYYNHVTDVAGGPDGNEFHLPSQLVALMIGGFGLVRLLYLKLTAWRSPGDRDPKVAEVLQTPHPPPKLRLNLGLLRIFSPAYGVDDALLKNAANAGEEDDANELDELARGRSWGTRCFITWLPWLALILSHHERPGDGESGAGHTPLISRRTNWNEEDERSSLDEEKLGEEKFDVEKHPHTTGSDRQ